MSDHEMASKHIDQLEKRLASLHDLGVDTAALRSQLAFARTQVHENRIAEALSICEEVADTARRLADGSATPPERPRTGRFTRDQLAEAVKDLLSQGLLAKLMAEQRSAPDVRLEARLNALDERLRGYVGQEADALRAEQQALRQDLDQVRRQLSSGGVSGGVSAAAAPTPALTSEEPAWSRALGEALRGVVERLPAVAAAPSEGATEPAWALQLSASLQAVAQRLEALPVASVAMPSEATSEPAWSQALSESLRAVAARVVEPVAVPVPAASPVVEPSEPAWSQALCESLRAVVAHLAELPPPAPAPAAPAEQAEPAWSQALGTTLQAVVQRLESVPTATFTAKPAAAASEAGEPAWSQALSDTLRTIAAKIDHSAGATSTPAPAEGEPAWSQALRDSLSAIAIRLTDQPLTLVAEQSSNSEPAWAITLREALGAAEARHQELLAMLAAQGARPAGDSAVADQVASALERGLHDLGTLLAQRPLPAPQPTDDSRVALSPMTAPVVEHVTTKSVGNTSTRTERVAVMPVIDSEQIHRMIESALEAHLGARNTAARGRPESGTEQIRALVAAELDVRQGGALDRTSRSDVVDFRATLLRLLPDLLGDEAVRQKLFAVLALEAVSKPGALGELTGLRSFLKRELARVAEDLSGKLQIA